MSVEGFVVFGVDLDVEERPSCSVRGPVDFGMVEIFFGEMSILLSSP